MWAIGAGLALAQPAWAKLEIVDIRACYGPRGPERKSLEAAPGDQVHFAFRVQGAQTDTDGKLDLTLNLDIGDPSGATRSQKRPIRDLLPLGEGTFPASTMVNFGPQTAPGEYTIKLTLVDNLSKDTASFERTVTCKKLDFAITQLAFFRDKEGKIPGASTDILGQAPFYRFSVVGFDKAKQQVKMTMLVQTLDKDGRDLMPKAQRFEAKIDDANVVAKATSINFTGFLVLNRVGEFQLRLTVIDQINERKADLTVPLKVVAP